VIGDKQAERFGDGALLAIGLLLMGLAVWLSLA